jgi:hypothetical protein
VQPEGLGKLMKQKMHVGGIFCDLAKAFECINHKILISKLHSVGIQGATVSGADP